MHLDSYCGLASLCRCLFWVRDKISGVRVLLARPLFAVCTTSQLTTRIFPLVNGDWRIDRLECKLYHSAFYLYSYREDHRPWDEKRLWWGKEKESLVARDIFQRNNFVCLCSVSKSSNCLLWRCNSYDDDLFRSQCAVAGAKLLLW